MAATARAENLIVNPNFEGANVGRSTTASITGWTLAGSATAFHTFDAVDSLFGYGYYSTNGTTNDRPWRGNPGTSDDNHFTDVTGVYIHTSEGSGATSTAQYFEAGTYNLTVDAAVVNYAPTTGAYTSYAFSYAFVPQLTYTLGDVTGNFTFSNGVSSAGWTTSDVATFTIETAGTYSLTLANGGSTGRGFITNASLEQVPEPGTWAMLAGLGLVGAAWYRRRK